MKENEMTFRIGDKVVYPSQGPCLIEAVVKKTIAGEPTSFYRLSLLDDSCDAVLVPIEKLRALHIRHLLAKSEIPKLLGHLENSPTTSKNWKQRAIDNAKLLASGSAFDLAEVVDTLTELNEAKALLPRDRQTLEKARKFLICEISEVMGESRNAAEGEIDRALNNKRTLPQSRAVLTPSFPSRRRHIKYASALR
jgi:CarD family transcriptional regulator, regulator of rRNA transcription